MRSVYIGLKMKNDSTINSHSFFFLLPRDAFPFAGNGNDNDDEKEVKEGKLYPLSFIVGLKNEINFPFRCV